MSKKNKKKTKGYYDYLSKKDKKKSKKKLAKYAAPKTKRVKLSLDKKDVKENKKIVLAPVDIPKAFAKNRAKCNHAGELITVAEFKAMTPNYGAYTPILEQVVAIYGEENVSICKSCYDVIVDPSVVSTESLEKAIAQLYVTANTVLSRQKLNKDEIKKIAKARDALSCWDFIAEELEKAEEKGRLESDNDYIGIEVSEEDLAKMSRGSAGVGII